jgi:hypothetical protein
MTISKRSTKGSLLIPKIGLANFMCAVLEMGKNSVMPSIIAMIID